MAGRVIISLIAFFMAANALPQHNYWGGSYDPRAVVVTDHRFASCELQPSSNSQVTGTLYLSEHLPGAVRINGVVSGLTPGYHGFHIHQNGALGNDCKDAGSHFNPFNALHGAPEDHHSQKHAGDFGNIYAGTNGQANIDIYSQGQVSVTAGSPVAVTGRSIVVHALPDDLGRGGDEESTKTGNAGARLACCIIQGPSR